MKKVNVIIERASDGTYSAYMDDYSLDYGLIGTGCSVDECIEDIKLAYAEMQQLFEERSRYFEEVEMVFSYDSSMTDCL